MILLSLHFILVLSTLTSTVHGLQKRKRDISDLKNDKLLNKVFPGHLEEEKERKDRSINIQDEQETNKKPSFFPSNFYLQPAFAPVMERRAVDPVQEAMSPFYSPASYYSNQVDQRNYIPHPETPATPQQGVNKKSDIPEAPQPSAQDSYPLHLRIKSQNSKLQGAVPHFEEYGETVESVLKAQKRFKIPRPEYSSVIVKKNDIPHPEDDFDDDVSEDMPAPTATTHNLKERSKITHQKKDRNGERRQYVQYPQMQQYGYNNAYASNYMNAANYMNAQQASAAFQQAPQQVSAASHVQNLDGAISRPIVSEKACDDQFSLCSEYAKNSYCTNYPEQMKVQCRKSCGFCVPAEQAAEGEAKAKINDNNNDDDDSSGTSASGSGEYEQQGSKRTVTENAVRRHDILQERGNIQPQQEADGSGSGSGDESGSGSGSGSSESATGPVESDKRSHNLQQEFHIPSKKDEAAAESEESGSGSGSGDESGDSENQKKTHIAEIKKVEAPKHVKAKIHKKSKIPAVHHQNKRGRIPNRPSQPLFYPRIDLKEIASSLAHYEEAALELAGEYPHLQDTDVTEYTRSFIPHPETSDEVRANRNRQNIQIAKIISSERARKSNVPKFLKVTGDVKKPEKAETDADSLDSVQRRFDVPGVEPTLNDYYAETGKLNPFDKITSKNYKKSRIENPFKFNYNYDPYEYLRNMPAGASMEPIIDPHKRSSIPSDHSYPVFLMKVSPSDEKKYVEEKPDRRGKIRHYNAEGVEISDRKYQQMLRGGHPEMEEAVRKQSMPQLAAPRSYAAPRPAAPRPKTQNVNINTALKRTQARLPPLPSMSVAPPAPPAPAAPQFQPFNQPSMYSQLQQSYEQQASMFPNTEQVPYEQQPGANSLRSKMLNAFFDMKSNSALEEGSAMGSGDSGLGSRRNVI